ncbi:MAG: phosphoribosylamine--glycine ligase [Hyphomicrobiales bacterium]|jgi:phosphoribosylamine--glycine ligase|nr:phosphoribosylamine--glycine ligase [Hyphomicrobiales bacterium]|tara:strand:+ start:54 stop:1322 length:1269 start_codon:yes stop_codon:yes gene_type:complete
MNILLIGGGGREHSIAEALSKSSKINELHCIPGNAGIEKIASCHNYDISNQQEILNFCENNNIDIVFIGPEIPLVEGLADYLNRNSFFTFGPNQKAAKLEGSKSFTKDMCKKYNIPTATYETFSNAKDALVYIDNHSIPLVIKVDGLAAGKGVIIAETRDHAINSVNEIFSGKFGNAGDEIVIEEFLDGEEASYFIISDGESFIPLTSAQDHKRIGDGDIGLNTGGMGAYSPAPIMNKELEEKTINKIIKPTIKAMNDYGSPYIGILYAGLMIKDNEPKLIEYNVRFGDPECQVIIPRLENDLVELLVNVKEKNLDNYTLKWKENFAITVVLAAKGYPESYETGDEIKGLDAIDNIDDVEIFHAGTKTKNNKIVTSGGRVLNINGYGKNLVDAKEKAYSLVKKINWSGCYYRKDIGWRALKE